MRHPIPAAPGYTIDALGEVRRGERLLRASLDKDGYRKVNLSAGDRTITARVCGLVCAAFHGERPPGLVCRHLNGRRDDDRADNLAWSTQAANCSDKIAHGTAQRGEAHPSARLSDEAVLVMRLGAEPVSVLARRYGVKPGTVRAVQARRRWRHV
jgi:hypothetical protein